MDILVKGMEMPRFCVDCPFWEIRYDPGYYNYEHCKALGKIFNECRRDISHFEEKLDDCPLVEIADTEWEWCHDCKEYDQEAHCCHRWTKVIRKTVEDVKESYKIVTCVECKHRDPEDKKCDSGQMERQGCIFPVADDYFCKYGERREDL